MKEIMDYILRICVPSTLHMVTQLTEVLIIKVDPLLIYQSNIHFMIRFTIFLGLRVYEIRSRKIYYSDDSC